MHYAAVGQNCSWTTYNSANNSILAGTINDIEADNENNIWVATNNGIVVFDGTTWTNHDSTTGLNQHIITQIKKDSEGTIWAGSPTGAYRYCDTTWIVFNSQNSILQGDNILDIETDRFGSLWFTTNTMVKSGGVTYFDGDNYWAIFSQADGLVSNDIADITIDADDNIWFASYNNLDTGITKLQGFSNWITYQYADSFPLVNIRKIKADLDGNIWILSDNYNGVIKFDGINSVFFNQSNSPLTGIIQCIEVDKQKNIWFGTTNGAYKFNGTTWTLFNTSNSGLPGNNIKDIAFDNNDNIWFATAYNGIAKLDLKSNIQISVSYNGNILDLNDVFLELYSVKLKSTNGSDSLIATIDSSLQMIFYFANIKAGKYYIRANINQNSQYQDLINSYNSVNDTVFLWQDADTVIVGECEWQDLIINMASYSSTGNVGNGIISGNIFYGNNQIKANNTPVSDAQVYLISETDNKAVAGNKTGPNGTFSFYGIATGETYKLHVDIPGLPMLETYSGLKITSSQTLIDSLDFFVDTSGISIENASGIIKINNHYSLKVYPNPSQGLITIEPGKNICPCQISIIDENGKVIHQQQQSGKYIFDFDANKLSKGVYYLRISAKNKLYLKKIIPVIYSD